MAATTSSSSWCQKFEPNIFNKAKCQNCFKPKEQHSSEALESSKATRKISKCGYLFVAPDSFDFTNPMDRSRRWQRRFFVLYDDGELTYSVDENVNTIPQGVIDMNQCTDVVDAEEITGHQLSVAILIADRSTYIKGTTKDETTRWYDVLVMYPRSNKVKSRRSPTYAAPKSTTSTTATSESEDVTCDTTASTGESSTFSSHGRTSAMAGPPAPLSLSRSWRSSERSPSPPPIWNSADPLWQSQPRSPTSSLLLNGRSKNETDEYKMAKSGDVSAVRSGSGHRLDTVHRESSPDVQYTKKGWLVKQGVTDKDWTKHWFVLNSSFLRYFRDSASEGSNQLDGVIDLSSIYRVTEVNVSRNYGFKLETQHGDIVLSAMTSGIRTKWMQALQACLQNSMATTSSATSSLASSPRSSLVDVRRGSGNSAASCGRQVSSLVDGVTTTRHASSPSLSHSVRAAKSLTDSSRASSNSSDRTNFTCTWPYKKMEGGAQGMSDSSTGSHSRLAGYLDDDDGQKDDDQHDGVTRSVRSVHRRSTAAESLLRSSHPRKFESRTASSELSSDDTDADTGAVSKRRVTRSHPRDLRSKSLGVPPSRETLETASKESLRKGKETARSVKDVGRGSKDGVRRKNSGELLKPTLHPYRAPSAKVKEKSRSKSPRTKSPPPDARKKDGKVKRKEGDLVPRPMRGTEGALIELLENQVGSLKTSLEKAQTELSEMTHTNTELKSQLHLVKQTHHSSLQDMTTTDRSQYLTHAQVIHDDFYPGCVIEPQKISEFAKLQVQTLKQQLCETQNTARGQQQQIGDLHHKLDLTAAALATTEAELTQTVRDLKVERDELRATADDWSSKVERLTKELTERDMLLESKERELRDVTSKLREAKVILDLKNDKIESLEVELHEVCGLKEELDDKMHQLDNLDHELAITKQHLREQDEEMQRAQHQYQATLKEREDEFYSEKAQLQQQVEQLQSTLTHPDLADTTLEELLSDKDETIAQLEEKLIEDNNKVQELSDELMLEMEDNDKMRVDLESAFEAQKMVTAELEQEKTAKSRLQKQVEVLKEGSKGREPELVLRCDQLQTELTDAQQLIDLLRKENDGLKAAVDELTVSVDDLKKRYEEEVWKNKQLQGLLETSQKASASNLQELAQLKMNYENVLGDLEQTNMELESVHDQLQETRSASAAQLGSKSEELSSSQKQVAGLQVQLTEVQSELSTLQAVEAATVHVDSDTALLTEGLPEELKTRYHMAVGEIKKLRKKLKDVQISQEKLESHNYSLKQELKNMEIGYQDQLNQLSNKVHELTNKLSVAERRVRRLDRSSSRYNSLGSSSEPESENTAHSSPCGSIVTQVNIQEALASIQQGVLMSMAENSSTCSSVASSVTAEVMSQPPGNDADGLVAKITSLQSEIAASENKVQELTAKLLHRRELEVELSVLQQSESSLKSQSHIQQQQIDSLKQQLNQQPLEVTAAEALQRHLQETETRLASTRSTLDVCHQKLCDIVEKLTQENSEMANDVRTKLEDIVNETNTDKSSSGIASGNVKLFAERLALEATILGEMAHISCDQQDHELHSVQKANLLLFNLEQQLASCQCSTAIGDKTQEEAIQMYAALLAEKIQLQDKMTDLIANTEGNDDDSNQERLESECVTTAARYVLSKAELDLQLTSSIHQQSTSVMSRALVMNELHTVLTQLSDQRRRTNNEKDQEMTEKLWQSNLQRLTERQSNMSDAIESYRRSKLLEIGNLFLKKHLRNVDDVTTNLTVIQAFDRDLLQAEFAAMLAKFVESYTTDEQQVEKKVKEERERFMSDLTQHCEQSDVQQQSTDSSGVDASLDDALNSAMMQLASVLAQKIVVEVLVSGVNSDKVSQTQSDSSTCATHSHKQLVSQLHQASQVKGRAASYLLNNVTDGSFSAPHGDMTRLATHLAETESQLLQHTALCASYSSAVAQEAQWQAELTYVTTRLNQQHQEELQRLTSHVTGADQQDGEAQELRNTLETRTEELRQKEARLAEEIKDMKCHLVEAQDQLEHKETSFRKEIAVLKEGYESRIKSLQENLAEAMAEHQPGQVEKDSMTASLTGELATTQSQLQQLQQEREEQKKDNDIVITALKADIEKLKEQVKISSTASSTGGADHSESLETEVSRLWKLLEDERRKHGKEVEQLRERLTGSTEDSTQNLYTSRVQEMQDQIQLMQVDYEQELELLRSAHRRELVRSKEEMMQLLAAAEEKSLRVDEESIRKKYVKEIERIKQMYDKGFASMEKSHHKVMMEMRKAHKRELDTLRQEKDQLLNEETKATQSALESMRNAHEAELQAERNKFLDLIVKTYSQADVEAFQHQHEDDLDLIQGEINQISEQYSIKVLECATLEERLDVQTKALHQSRKRVQDLIARNEELNTKLKHEIQKLNRMVTNPGTNNLSSEGGPAEVNELRVALKIKEAEIHQLQEEIKSWKEQLHDTVEELEDSMEMYHDLYSEHTSTKQRYEKELTQLKEKLQRAVPSSTSGDEPSSGDDESYNSSGDQSEGEEPAMEGACAASPPQVLRGISSKRRQQWRQRDQARAHSNPNLTGSEELLGSTDSLSSSPRTSTSRERHLSTGTEPSLQRHSSIPSVNISQEDVRDT